MTAIRSIIAVMVCATLITLVAAQSPSPSPTPQPAPCDDPAALSTQIAELYLTLNTLRDSLEAGDTNALGSVYDVGLRYQAIALECGYLPDNVDGLVINTTDIDRVLDVLQTLAGDPLRGKLLYDGQEPSAGNTILGCYGCHTPGLVAPATEGTWTRWDEEHRFEERFAGYDFDRYVVEAVLLPWDYFVPTYPEYTMPDFYHEQLGYQDLADLVAYLESQDQLP